MSGEESLRRVRSWPGRKGSREDLIEAVVELAGERGFADLTLAAVVERAGSSLRTFHRHFEGLDDAFGEGYERVAGELCDELLAAGRVDVDWRRGFREGLGAFLRWVAANPRLARVVLSEYRIAGGRAWRAHDHAAGRVATAIDSSRAGLTKQPAPALATGYLIGGIEFTVAERVRNGEAREVPELEPSLAYLAVSLYCGHELAAEELGR